MCQQLTENKKNKLSYFEQFYAEGLAVWPIARIWFVYKLQYLMSSLLHIPLITISKFDFTQHL